MAQPRVLVVGGGMGIGQFVTEFLVQKHAAKVVVLGLDVSESVQQLEKANKLCVVRGDATEPTTQGRAMSTVSEYLGGLDALVITLGILGEVETVARLDIEKMRRAFEINFFAPVQLTQQYLPLLRKSKGRAIILSSMVDRELTYSGWSPYSTSKAALTRFIEGLGHEEDQVDVLGIYPGLTRTTMVTDLVAGKYSGKMTDAEVDDFKRRDREGEVEPPEWTANVTAKLAAGAIQGKGQGRVLWYHELHDDYKSYGP